MEASFLEHRDPLTLFHFERSRLNNLFMEAVKYPLVLVCAGAGYGKTTAVHDFVQEYQATTLWVQLSERDNVGGRFWENITHAMTQINTSLAKAMNKLGFPDTAEKLNQYHTILREHADKKQRVIVFDDCHCIEDPDVIRFVEQAFMDIPPGNSLFLVSRSSPHINTAGLVSKGRMFNINENDLRFTESELAQYFRRLEISIRPDKGYSNDTLREIMQDTEGWAFAINLIARHYQKAPGYGGYLRNAMKTNIFLLMESEIWDETSERLQRFLVRLSLIDHLSVDLITLLAGPDSDLIGEMERQNAYVRRDSHINAYLIHPLFLEFLSTKQELLSEEQKLETYLIAGKWCNKNGFKIDALTYYEKVGDYKSIISMLIELPTQIPYDIACFAAAIFDRTPQEVFDTVDLLVSRQLSVYMSQGLWQKTIELAEYYEAKYIKLPKNDPFRRLTLGSLYYCQALTRISMCLTEDRYDFDSYFEKLDNCFPDPIDPGKLVKSCPGPWICNVGSSRKGAPEEYIGALSRSFAHISRCFNGFETGEDDLALGELKFYQGDVLSAEPFIVRALDRARENRQFEVVHRSLFYTLRIAVLHGDYPRAVQTMKDLKTQLDEVDYFNRYINYDISLSWYYCILGMAEQIPDWIKDSFVPYSYAGFIENYANQMKARFCYSTRCYLPLLSYIQDMKQRESFLFGRIEMLALEACVHYRMKDKPAAFEALAEAYETASPNNILMPFIELGKDMRTLTSTALKKTDISIPKSWLETVYRKSVSYTKRQAHIITEYRHANRIVENTVISPREAEILVNLSQGFSRAEIAANLNLSVNTVKMVINNIYSKLGAENLPDLIRIAMERKII